jgi:polyhydroxyalkanoate synthesis regulator phasin
LIGNTGGWNNWTPSRDKIIYKEGVMKKMTYLAVFMVVVFFVGITITGALAASPPVPDIKKRVSDQQKRIDERVKSGALTRNEGKVLLDNLNRIEIEEKRLKEDGKLTEEEGTRLHKLLDQNSKMIEDKKNNPVTANAPYMEWRFTNQQKRINEGIKSGALTRDEAKILQDNLNHVQQEEKRLAAGGKLTQEERDRLHKILDQNSRMIDDKKKNPVTAVAPQIQQRVANQQKRINEGIKSGALTQDESKTLQDNLNYVQQEEKRLTAAGKFTQADKDRLNRILDQNSKMVEDLKSNPAKKLY